jgi:hypothetical protein
MPSINKVENLFIGIGHLWFLLMLYEVFVIVILGAKFLCINASRWHLFLLYICLCIIFCLYHIFSNHQFFLCIHATLLYLPAFILGICCARFHFEHIITGKWARILLLMSLACLSIYMLYDIKTPFIADYLIQMLTGYTIILCTFVLLSKKTHSTKKLPNIITNADHLSLGIYIFNQIVINALLLMPGIPYVLNNHYYIGVPMLFLIGLIIPYTLTWLLCKNRYLKWTIGG